MKLNRITALLMLSSLPLMATAASYNVVELPTKDLSLNQFGTAIDETGVVLTTLSQPFNPPIDLSLIDLSLFTLNDPVGAAAGNFEADDFNLISGFIYLQTTNNSLFGQKLAAQIGYQTDGTDFSYISGFDQVTDGTNGFTFAQKTTLGDTVNGTHIVGTMAGPFSKLPYTNTEGTDLLFTVNDFSLRAFVQVGDNVTELAPDDISSGGVSTAEAINKNLQVAGSVSISEIPGQRNLIDDCYDDTERGDQPLEVCLYTIRLGQSGRDTFFEFADRRAIVWQVDATGALIDKTQYGLLFEPELTDTRTQAISSQAAAINDSGVAVGSSDVPFGSRFAPTAAIFENGEMIRIIEDETLMPNTATGINNNGYIVGYQSLAVNQVLRTKMFIFNRNTNDLTFSNGFFVNSSTIPRAINNDNLVVGEGESDAAQGVRRRSGFVYDIEADTFTNLNSLIPCDADYEIIGANDINDSGEIIADALVKRPTRDFQGTERANSDGVIEQTDNIIAVKLVPTGQPPSTCSLSPEEIEEGSRQGAGVGFLTLFGLLLLSLFSKPKIKA